MCRDLGVIHIYHETKNLRSKEGDKVVRRRKIEKISLLGGSTGKCSTPKQQRWKGTELASRVLS